MVSNEVVPLVSSQVVQLTNIGRSKDQRDLLLLLLLDHLLLELLLLLWNLVLLWLAWLVWLLCLNWSDSWLWHLVLWNLLSVLEVGSVVLVLVVTILLLTLLMMLLILML